MDELQVPRFPLLFELALLLLEFFGELSLTGLTCGR